jgi:hypothetical protein
MKRASGPGIAGAILAKTAAALLAAVLLSSCWRPVFDEQVSAGALFYDKIGSPFRAIGPVSLNSDMIGGTFLPERNVDPYNGFWLQLGSSSVQANFIKYSGGSYGLSSASTGMPTSGGSMTFTSSAYFTTNQRVILGTGSSTATTGMSIETFTAGTSDSFTPDSSNPYAPTGASSILGLGATQVAGTLQDTIAVIYRATSTLMAASGTSSSAILSIGTGFALNAGTADVAAVGRAFIGGDGGGDALYYYGGGNTVLRWTWTSGSGASGTPTTITVQDPLVGVLSNGTLVCQGKDYLDAYRPDGSEIFSTPAGSVRFVHEVDYSGVDYCIFAQVLLAPRDNSGNNEVYVELWRLPTSSFSGLGG